MSGIAYVEYSLNAGPVARMDDPGSVFSVPLPNNHSGYVTFELWVYDRAGNRAHDVVLLWLVDGAVKSIQPVADGRFRVVWVDSGTRVEALDTSPAVVEIRTWNVDLLPPGFLITKLPDQSPR